MARSASSLPGITQSTWSGSELVSTTATTGTPMRRASRTAISSLCESTTNMASGGVVMFSTPSRFWFRCFNSRSRRAASFFESCAMRPSSIMALSVFSRLMDFCSVAQLVSVPPSQR